LTSIQEKLDQETGRKIYPYKQGVFWTVYEQSAMILNRYKPLKISIKLVKTAKHQVISVGFPDTTLTFFSETPDPFMDLGYP